MDPPTHTGGEQTMSCKPDREEQDSQELSAGPRGVMPAMTDIAAALFELQKKRKEEGVLKAVHQERSRVLDSLDKCTEELKQHYSNAHGSTLDLFHKNVEVSKAVQKVERQSQEILGLEVELERLKEKRAQLEKRRQEQASEIQRCRMYWDFLEKLLRIITFEDIESLIGYLERLLQSRDELYKRYSEVQDQADELRAVVVSLEDEHHLIHLEKTNQISQLQSELDDTLSEALIWERTWDQIREKSAKQTLLLGQIKMAVLNLYEKADGTFEDGIGMTDTEKQLHKIKLFIQEHGDIMTLYQSGLGQDSDEQKTEKPSGSSHKKIH